MEARLTAIERGEVLRYLRIRGEAAGELDGELSRLEARLLETARPRLVWRVFALLPDGSLDGCAYTPGGEDIRKLLRESGQVVLFAATLGAEAEALQRRAQSRSMREALLLDALGNAAIENVCDNFCADLAAAVAPRCLTERFSPGYGDLPLEDQRAFFQALDVTRRIGVTLTESLLMLPQKSVTALLGIAERPQPRRGGCGECDKRESCVYKRGRCSVMCGFGGVQSGASL